MKLSEKSIKVVFIATAIIEVILVMFLLANCYEHYMSNNIWVEDDDKGLGPIMCVIVVAILVLFFMILLNAKSKSRNPKTVKKKIDIPAAKKHFLSSIGHNISLLILFRIISERIVRAIVIDLFSLDLSEAAYMAGHYGIFRHYFSIMLIVLLISDVILVAMLCNLKETTHISDNNVHKEGNILNIQEKSVQNVTDNSIETVKSDNLGDADAIRCINCGKQVNSDDIFCAYCGEKVLKNDKNVANPMIEHTKKLCPNCSSKVEIGNIFCVNCGSKIDN